MTGRSLLIAVPLLIAFSPTSGLEDLSFTRKPVATRSGDTVRIDFAVSRETDVAVYVETAEGKIVRHLAAGAIGKNAPAPLKAGSLEQSLVWDGNDDDRKPAIGGPFRVRVGVGLRASWGGQAFGDKDQAGPNQIGGAGIAGMAAGPDGRLYTLGKRGGKVHWRGMWVVHAFRRDGSYEQTIKPPPANTPADQLQAVGAFRNEGGELTPVLFNPLNMTFYPYVEMAQQPAVTPQGHVLLAVQPPGRSTEDTLAPGIHLAALDREGRIPYPDYAGPLLDEKRKHVGYPYLASGADGTSVFLTGLGTQDKAGVQKAHAVYRAPLPERGPAKVLFGDPDKSGNDETHLDSPSGLAIDGGGHLLVSDSGNNRVVVLREKDGGFAGSFAVDKPSWVAVHPRTGAVYVQSGEIVIKYSGWKNGREVARLEGLDKLLGTAPSVWGAYAKSMRRSFALDSSAEPPVLWIGRNSGPRSLMRCEDQGDKFTAPQAVPCYDSPEFWNLSADPTRREVCCRVEPPKAGGSWTRDLRILNDETGDIRKVSPKPVYTHQGAIYRLGPGGQIFCMSVLSSISRHDRDGKFLPYDTKEDKTGTSAQTKKVTNDGLMENTPTGSSGWTRDFFVARDGDVYVHRRTGGGGSLVAIDRVSGKTGRFVKTVVGTATRNAIGPRVDPAGNLYLAECLKPGGRRVPEVFESHLRPKLKDLYSMQYGSLIKFGPEGGTVEWPVKEAESAGNVDLPATLKTEKVPGNWYLDLFSGNPRLTDATVRGAQWIRPGFSKIGRPYCFCLTVDFDVDDFGRVFYPDLLQFRVGVLDTNGNPILTFGGYGNQDNCGPDSYVVDPKDKTLRPRKAGDPKDLVSPFAKPDLGFAWISGLAVTDRHAYVADEVNRRVLRVKLEYAATETAPIP
jgi:hypothetical protein